MARQICIFVFLAFVLAPMTSVQAYALDVLIVKSANITPYNEAERGFRSGVSARIRTIVLEKSLEEETKEFSEKLGKYPVDLIFAIGDKALTITTPYINKMPLVFAYVFDPESILGARVNNVEAGGLAGVRMTVPPENQLQIFKQAVPSARKIGVVYDPAKTQSLVDRANEAAPRLGLEVVARAITSTKEVVDAIESLNNCDAILMLPDTTVLNAATDKYFLLFSFRNKIPLIGLSEKHVKKGALLGLAFENEAMGEQSGSLAMQIVRGGTADKVTIEEPKKLSVILNANTVKKMDLNIGEDFIKSVNVEY